MKYLKKLALCLLLSHAALSQAAVSVSGDVLKPVRVAYTPGMRLLGLISQVRPNPESYWLQRRGCISPKWKSRHD